MGGWRDGGWRVDGRAGVWWLSPSNPTPEAVGLGCVPGKEQP